MDIAKLNTRVIIFPLDEQHGTGVIVNKFLLLVHKTKIIFDIMNDTLKLKYLQNCKHGPEHYKYLLDRYAFDTYPVNNERLMAKLSSKYLLLWLKINTDNISNDGLKYYANDVKLDLLNILTSALGIEKIENKKELLYNVLVNQREIYETINREVNRYR